MQFWLLKSEPSEYSWQKMEKEHIIEWDGVHNYQAQNYMRAMKLSDLAFFYHTGKEKAILGIVEVSKEYYYTQPPVIRVADTQLYERCSVEGKSTKNGMPSFLSSQCVTLGSRYKNINVNGENKMDPSVRYFDDNGRATLMTGKINNQIAIETQRSYSCVSATQVTPERVAYNLKFGLVDVSFSKPLNNQVTLNDIKQNPLLKNMSILKQPRLSVSPVSEVEWNEIIRMSEC